MNTASLASDDVIQPGTVSFEGVHVIDVNVCPSAVGGRTLVLRSGDENTHSIQNQGLCSPSTFEPDDCIVHHMRHRNDVDTKPLTSSLAAQWQRKPKEEKQTADSVEDVPPYRTHGILQV